MGYDSLTGYLAGGILAWQKTGRDTASIKTVSVQELCGILDANSDTWILDVRNERELRHDGEIPGAHHIPVTHMEQRQKEVPRDRMVYIFCGSGVRSMLVASLLRKQGWDKLTVVLGGFKAWKSVACPIRQPKAAA
jgi:hydroxyacylglutathione hydrolase